MGLAWLGEGFEWDRVWSRVAKPSRQLLFLGRSFGCGLRSGSSGLRVSFVLVSCGFNLKVWLSFSLIRVKTGTPVQVLKRITKLSRVAQVYV